MDTMLEKAREIGALIQNEECFKQYLNAKKSNDDDEDLQKCIGEFNIIKLSMDKELEKTEKDEEKLKSLNEDLREIYGRIMANESMKAFEQAKKALDKLVNDVYSVIIRCASGEDPKTVEFDASCGGNCSSCGGCH